MKSLIEKGDERLAKYDQSEIYRILQDNDFHSPELSVTDDENPSLKHIINVYDLSWRSDEVYYLYYFTGIGKFASSILTNNIDFFLLVETPFTKYTRSAFAIFTNSATNETSKL